MEDEGRMGRESSAKNVLFLEIALHPECCVIVGVEKKLAKHVDIWFANFYRNRKNPMGYRVLISVDIIASCTFAEED